MSESDITLDYDDDVRDPDWKAPDKTPSTDTDENNNIPVNVDQDEVIEPQNTDSNNGSKWKTAKRKQCKRENE